MQLKILARKLSRPICQTLEIALEQTGRWESAQRFRQAQHRALGLSDREWESLRAYFVYYELLGVTAQRYITLKRMRHRLEVKKDRATDPVQAGEIQQAIEILEADLEDNGKAHERAKGRLRLAMQGLDTTPVSRALRAQQRRRAWYMSDWLVSRCQEFDGCCARGCGCCRKYRYGKWEGHCTPACSCCQRDRGMPFPIDVEGYREEIYFDLDPLAADVFSWRVMNAYIWGLPERSGQP
ncbi:hypothetical protein BJX76DRAFT_364624 [Aspergillus varians]